MLFVHEPVALNYFSCIINLDICSCKVHHLNLSCRYLPFIIPDPLFIIFTLIAGQEFTSVDSRDFLVLKLLLEFGQQTTRIGDEREGGRKVMMPYLFLRG